MRNEVIFDPSNKILVGAKLMYDAVKSTAGASGKNVIIKSSARPLIVTKDGWTVAKSIEVPDDIEAIGAEALLSASDSANNENGDGSTAAVILGYHLLDGGFKAASKYKCNLFQLSKGIEDAFFAVEEKIRKNSKKDFNLLDIAKISTNNDIELATAINESINLVGKDGSVYVEPSNTKETYVKKQEGVAFPAGYMSYAFANNEKYTAKYSDPLLLIIDHDLEDAKEVRNFMMYANSYAKRPLIIIANDYNNDVLNMLTANRTKGNLHIVAIKSPFFGEKRSLFLEDLAHMTGAELIGEKKSNYKTLGLKGQGDDRIKSSEKILGSLKSIVVSAEETIIHYNRLNQDYIDRLEKELPSGLNYINERYNILTSMVASIFVGATTELELNERMYRSEDAINAVKSALNNGIVEGGGLALLKTKIKKPTGLTESESRGWDVLIKSIKKPAEVIVSNYDKELYPELLKSKDLGIDVRTGEFCNFFESGIIDPTDVIIGSLKHAVSVAKTLLTTEVAVFNTKR